MPGTAGGDLRRRDQRAARSDERPVLGPAMLQDLRQRECRSAITSIASCRYRHAVTLLIPVPRARINRLAAFLNQRSTSACARAVAAHWSGREPGRRLCAVSRPVTISGGRGPVETGTTGYRRGVVAGRDQAILRAADPSGQDLAP